MAQAGRRFMIDGSMASTGGGFTYLVNLLPELIKALNERSADLIGRLGYESIG